MNKNLINVIATIIIALILSQFLPWGSVMVSSFVTALFIRLKGGAVFFAPFLSISLLWIVHAFWLSSANDFTLAKKIAILLPLQGNAYLLIILTGIIGGLAAGVSGILGNQCVTLFVNKRS